MHQGHWCQLGVLDKYMLTIVHQNDLPKGFHIDDNLCVYEIYLLIDSGVVILKLKIIKTFCTPIDLV